VYKVNIFISIIAIFYKASYSIYTKNSSMKGIPNNRKLYDKSNKTVHLTTSTINNFWQRIITKGYNKIERQMKN
jgi:hypothetical protein